MEKINKKIRQNENRTNFNQVMEEGKKKRQKDPLTFQ